MEEQKQYYWVDLESGVRFPCTKEYYDGMKKIWNEAIPKRVLSPGVMVITGTPSGKNHFTKEFYEMDEKAHWKSPFIAGIDPITSDKSSVGSCMGMFIPTNWKQVKIDKE